MQESTRPRSQRQGSCNGGAERVEAQEQHNHEHNQLTGTIYLLLCVFFWLASPVCAGIYGSRVAETDAIVQLSICSTRHQASCDVEEYAGGMSAKTRARVGTDRRPRGAVLTCWCTKCGSHTTGHSEVPRHRSPAPVRWGSIRRRRSHAIMDGFRIHRSLSGSCGRWHGCTEARQSTRLKVKRYPSQQLESQQVLYNFTNLRLAELSLCRLAALVRRRAVHTTRYTARL